MKTAYGVLGVRRNASVARIKTAFRKAAKARHPDLNPADPSSEHELRRVIAAYNVLKNPEQRALYDECLRHRRRARMRQFWSAGVAGRVSAGMAALMLFPAVWLWKAQGPSEIPPTDRFVAAGVSQPAAQQLADDDGGALEERNGGRKSAGGTAGSLHDRDALESGPALSKLERPPDAAGGPRSSSDQPGTTNVTVKRMEEGVPSIPALTVPVLAKDNHRAEKAATPTDPVFYLARGELGSDRADFDQAIADFTEAIRLDPGRAVAYLHRGNAWSSKGDLDRALLDYGEAIRIDPNSSTVFRQRGIAWRRKGDLDRALVDFDRAIRMGFSDANAYNERGLVWYEKKRYERALADFSRAIQLDPNLVSASVNRAAALRSKSDADRAMADVRATRLDPGQTRGP